MSSHKTEDQPKTPKIPTKDELTAGDPGPAAGPYSTIDHC